MSDSTDVGCAIATAAKAAVRSSVPGVQAGTRGAKEGELGPRLQQQRQGSGVVSCADIKARNCGAMLLPLQAALCVSLLPLFPLARRGLGAPAACPPGRRGRPARLARRHYAPQGATPHLPCTPQKPLQGVWGARGLRAPGLRAQAGSGRGPGPLRWAWAEGGGAVARPELTKN